MIPCWVRRYSWPRLLAWVLTEIAAAPLQAMPAVKPKPLPAAIRIVYSISRGAGDFAMLISRLNIAAVSVVAQTFVFSGLLVGHDSKAVDAAVSEGYRTSLNKQETRLFSTHVNKLQYSKILFAAILRPRRDCNQRPD